MKIEGITLRELRMRQNAPFETMFREGSRSRFRKNLRWSTVVLFVCWSSTALFSQTAATLPDRIQTIMGRPEFAHSTFGIEFFSLDSGKVLYQLNADKLMVPGSTTKLLTEGTVLELLSGDHRFHTRVYRTGPIRKDGTLDGDIVLPASGDPNLSGRVQPDGTLAFENMDHSYGGPDSKGLGDPLLVIRELAQQIANQGIKRVKGSVLVDASFFPEGERELGTNVVVSPIVVNDNVVDVIAAAGDKEGAPVNLQISPKTAYVQIINEATTGKASSTPSLTYTAESLHPDGTRSATLAGTLPLGSGPRMMAYAVPEPSHFAATVLAETLKQIGVEVTTVPRTTNPDFKVLAAHYKPENLLAEHISPPLKEDVRITLKLSQNLHATMGPFLLGALVAPSPHSGRTIRFRPRFLKHLCLGVQLGLRYRGCILRYRFGDCAPGRGPLRTGSPSASCHCEKR